MATVVTSTMLGGLRQHIVDMCSYAEFKAGGSWHRVELDYAIVQQNGAVHIAFYITTDYGDATDFRLLDANGNVLAQKTETIEFAPLVSKILYRFKFAVNVLNE